MVNNELIMNTYSNLSRAFDLLRSHHCKIYCETYDDSCTSTLIVFVNHINCHMNARFGIGLPYNRCNNEMVLDNE